MSQELETKSLSSGITDLDLTAEQFERVLPKHVKGALKKEMLDNINSINQDPEFRRNYKENLISYASVMQDGKHKMTSYIDAVRYCSFKLLGIGNGEAYIKTFPDRYQRLLMNGVSSKDIASYATAYSKNAIVNKIMEQSLIPSYILNADVYQKAINIQADLMVHANSEKVRTDAANSLLTHLKRPEAAKIELDIGIKENKTISDLKATITQLAEVQARNIENQVVSVVDTAESKIIEVVEDGDYVE